MHKMLKLLFFLLIAITTVFAQDAGQVERYRNEPYGNIQYRRQGLMDGNQVRTIFYNNGEVAQWPFQPSGEWPKGSGHSYLDGVTVLIATEVKVDNLQTPAPGDSMVFHPLEASYREWMDEDPVTGEIWGLEPVPGYLNPNSEDPAISGKPYSWPDKWPDALNLPDTLWINHKEVDGQPNVDDDKDGFVDNYTYWYGYFGRGVVNSDFETFFVMDDSKDGEFARAPWNYYPIASDSNRAGIGIRVEVRGFQWSHVLAEDIIFWHYDIVNIADKTYPNTYFGFYTDTGVGGTGDSGDDWASFDIQKDIAYAFDDDGFGTPGRYKTGYYGYAYLESPGNPFDGIDNDQDGMVDERRDDGIDNDGDWVGYTDLNGNGKWDADESEPLNNDVGTDGVGPFDLQYTGPDPDGTEGNGIPDNGEPNFEALDKDESDQIGLTSLSIYRLGDGGTGGGWPKDDEQMWLRMQAANFDTSLQNANISMVFASGAFPLKQGRRQRFSMALVFGSDFEDMIFNKETVQQIYNANYNFSKPPLKPTLTAVPGDEKVFLYWNDIAEQSRDPFLGFENDDPTQGYKKDFEGYLIYRSRDPEFNDIKIITDSKGEPKYWKPINQFDLVDGIKGPDPIGINGAHFWRGEDSGLQHSFVDTDVRNGVKYYYALVSYDMGDPNFGTAGLVPSECTKIITEDFNGTLRFVDVNCAVVTPNAPAAGYIPPQLVGDLKHVADGIGTGTLNVNILNGSEIKEGATYKVLFNSTGDFPYMATTNYKVVRDFNGSSDTLITVPAAEIGPTKTSEPFDGMTISVRNDTSVVLIDSLTGWLVGDVNLQMPVKPDESSPARNIAWPGTYELRFTDTEQGKTPFFKIPKYFVPIYTTTGDTIDVEIFDNDGNKELSIGDEIVLIQYIGNKYHITWRISYLQPAGIGYQPKYPQPGDVFRITTTQQFKTGDYFSFSTKSASVNKDAALSELEKITVVPNPYIGTASWERRNLNQSGRGERRIDFINLPAECTVRIYTVTGQLVKTLYKEMAPTDGTLSWNLVSDDGMDVAFGLYIYHVDAPGIGEHIGKFALIK